MDPQILFEVVQSLLVALSLYLGGAAYARRTTTESTPPEPEPTAEPVGVVASPPENLAARVVHRAFVSPRKRPRPAAEVVVPVCECGIPGKVCQIHRT